MYANLECLQCNFEIMKTKNLNEKMLIEHECLT